MRCLLQAAEEDNAAEVGALLGRPDKAQFVNAGGEVRCSRQHIITNTPARQLIIIHQFK